MQQQLCICESAFLTACLGKKGGGGGTEPLLTSCHCDPLEIAIRVKTTNTLNMAAQCEKTLLVLLRYLTTLF